MKEQLCHTPTFVHRFEHFSILNNLVLVVADLLRARRARNQFWFVEGIPNHPIPFAGVPFLRLCFDIFRKMC